MVTYTLGQSVSENSALLFFHKRILGCSFCLRIAPHSGRGKWPQHFMRCGSVYSAACIFFRGRSGIVFTNVCMCAHWGMCLLHCIYASLFALTR